MRSGAGKEAICQFETDCDGAATARRITGVDGQATDNCVASNSTIRYDANGFRDTEKDGRDFYTDYDFNAYGQETRRSEAMIMFEGSLIETDDTCVTETDWTASGRVEETRKDGITTDVLARNPAVQKPLDDLEQARRFASPAHSDAARGRRAAVDRERGGRQGEPLAHDRGLC